MPTLQKYLLILFILTLTSFTSRICNAGQPIKIDYSASFVATASSGEFAPYMIGSWNNGKFFASNNAWLDLGAKKEMTLDKRFNWGVGVEFLSGYGSSADYDLWDNTNKKWTSRSAKAAGIVHLQQLYAEVKYRGVYLTAGMKSKPSGIVNDDYSSGDLTRSNNARPIPGVHIGFVDFQNIPFTNGWVQIDGEIMYGKRFDNATSANRYNYYSDLLPQDIWYTYKRCYFRTKPSMPLSVTVGMQAAGTFAGNTVYYTKGEFMQRSDRGFHFRDIFDMFFPMTGNGEGYIKGSSLGSWDFKARYQLRSGAKLTAYFEWPWEDGSSIGRRNGWDGLWGIQFDFAKKGFLSTIVAEYFDTRNQSGPVHWAPGDRPGSSIDTEATGGDNYFNNDVYGPYVNYGLALGNPFLLSPIYNTDGQWIFKYCRAQGVHLALGGSLPHQWDYRVKYSYQRAWGSGRVPLADFLYDNSISVEASWTPLPDKLPGLNINAQLALDLGTLRDNNFGALVAVNYRGDFTFNKQAKR